MTLKFKNKPEDQEPYYSSDPNYDLLDGGGLDPEDMLEEEDAGLVRDAIVLINQFLQEAEDNNHLVIS